IDGERQFKGDPRIGSGACNVNIVIGFEHSPQTIQHQRMIVHEQYANLAFIRHATSGSRVFSVADFGRRAVSCVPSVLVSTKSTPPKCAIRSCIFLSPRPDSGSFKSRAVKPLPSSATVIVTLPPASQRRMLTRLAPE